MTTPVQQPSAAAPKGALASWWRRSAAQMRQRPILVGLVLLVLVGVAAAAAYFAYQHYEARRHWQEAQRLIADYQFREARPHLEACFALWKQSGETAFVLARTCRRSGDIPAAQEYLKEAERLQWPEAQLSFEYTLLRLQQEGATSADEAFVQRYLEKRSPEEVLVLEALCAGFFRNNQTGMTQSVLNHWVNHYPHDWKPWLWRGDYFQSVGNNIVAQQDLERVLELKPDHQEARRILISVLLKNGNPRRALGLIDEYLRQYPDHPEVLAKRAKCQRDSAQPDAARATLERLLEKNPKHASALGTLAQVEMDQDKPQAALRWLRELEEIPQNDNEEINTAARLRIVVYGRLGMEKEAKAAEARLQQINEANAEYNAVMDELKKRPPTVADRFKLGELTLKIGLEGQARYWLEGIARESPAERPKVQRLLLEFYEKRTDAEARRIAADLRRELGVAAP